MTNDALYQKALRRLGITERELLGHRRSQHLVDARCLVAAALMHQPLMRQQDVAAILGISQAAVSHLLARHRDLLEVDTNYQRKYELIID